MRKMTIKEAFEHFKECQEDCMLNIKEILEAIKRLNNNIPGSFTIDYDIDVQIIWVNWVGFHVYFRSLYNSKGSFIEYGEWHYEEGNDAVKKLQPEGQWKPRTAFKDNIFTIDLFVESFFVDKAENNFEDNKFLYFDKPL